MKFEEIVQGINQTVDTSTENLALEINKNSTDTRTIQAGDFYIPLKGENFKQIFIYH